MKPGQLEAWIYALLFIVGILVLGYFIPRTSFNLILVVFSGCFILYWRLYQISLSGANWKNLLYLAITLRLVLLFSVPPWSEDYARFLWDGHLVAEGLNPYSITPTAVREQWQFPSSSAMEELYALMNSPDYHSVYPPSNQLVFAMAVTLGNGELLHGVIIIRVILGLFEMLTFYLFHLLLRLFHQPPQNLLLYALNPLVIMEVIGNLHFEGMMLTMILAGIYFLGKSNFMYAGGFIGAAAAVKLSPLMLIPAFFQHIPKRAYFRFSIAALGCLLIMVSPLLIEGLRGFGQSLMLYGNTFEFNASSYYLLRQIGYWVYGYNTIEFLGPLMKLLTLALILVISFKSKTGNGQAFLETLLLVYWAYFLLSTVVHPWYIIPAVGISVLTKKKAFLLWSFLIVLSYNAYQTQPYSESSWLLLLQYGILAVALWKDGFHRKSSTSTTFSVSS